MDQYIVADPPKALGDDIYLEGDAYSSQVLAALTYKEIQLLISRLQALRSSKNTPVDITQTSTSPDFQVALAESGLQDLPSVIDEAVQWDQVGQGRITTAPASR